MAAVREARGGQTPREVGVKRRLGMGKENMGPTLGGSKRIRMAEGPVRPQVDAGLVSLQEQIERENKIRDGATKLLQASKNPHQAMEASKGLFVSNAKILALMREIQQKKEGGKGNGSNEEVQPCKAKIAISEIRIPLEWREFEHTKGKIDPHTKFGVFCLFRMGNQVMDTPTLVEVDRSTMDITFRDTVIFPEKVGQDSLLEVEVYCSVPPESTPTKPSTPIRMLRRLSARTRDEPPAHATSPFPASPYISHLPSLPHSHRFALAGYTQLSLKDISGSNRTYVLRRGAVGASGTACTMGSEEPLLPLWGQICCKLMAQPDCATKPRITGFINVQRMVGGLPDWHRLWCVMRQHHLRCWTYPEDVGRRMPALCLQLTKSMVVEVASRLAIRRPNTLLIKDRKSEFFVTFECREERDQWMTAIRQAIVDVQVWGDLGDFIIPVPHSKFYGDSPSMEFQTLPPLPDNKPRPQDATDGHTETLL